MQVPLIEHGLFCQLCQVQSFTLKYGHTYLDYLQNTLEESEIEGKYKDIIREIRDVNTLFKVLDEYCIEYTLTKNISLYIEYL